MSNHKQRLEKLETQQQSPADVLAWAEILDAGRAVLRYQDGRRIEATEADIPRGVKVYKGFSPDWDVTL